MKNIVRRIFPAKPQKPKDELVKLLSTTSQPLTLDQRVEMLYLMITLIHENEMTLEDIIAEWEGMY